MKKKICFKILIFLTFTLLLFSYPFLYHGIANTIEMRNISVGREVAIRVLFDHRLPSEQVDQIGDALLGRPEVSEIVYVPLDAAWQEFMEKYFSDNLHLVQTNVPGGIFNEYFEVYIISGDNIFSLLFGFSKLEEKKSELINYAEGLEGVHSVHRAE